MSRHLLISETLIGANICGAPAGESSRDFLHKMSIASKEAEETHYWLKLLQKNEFIPNNLKKELELCEELIRMLAAIVKTTSSKTSN